MKAVGFAGETTTGVVFLNRAASDTAINLTRLTGQAILSPGNARLPAIPRQAAQMAHLPDDPATQWCCSTCLPASKNFRVKTGGVALRPTGEIRNAGNAQNF